MTKIPSGEERVESLQVTSKLETNEQYLERVQKIMQQDRLALLTELRDSGLLEEKTKETEGVVHETALGLQNRKAHNTLARDIKTHLDELIKSTSIWNTE